MSKMISARRTVALIAVLMLTFAPVTFAADGGSWSIFSAVEEVVENLVDALQEVVGVQGQTENGDDTTGEDGGDDDGTPDLNPDIDPIG